MNPKLAAYHSNKQRRGTDNSNQEGQCELDCDVNGAYTNKDDVPPLPGESLHPNDGCSAVAGVHLRNTEEMSDVTPHDN